VIAADAVARFNGVCTMARKRFNPGLIRVPGGEGAAAPAGPLTVSQLTALVKAALEIHLPATLHVLGQLSNFKRHSSGHWYFTLKDREAELGCVMWRSAASGVKFAPADGLEVIATGGIEVFERAGRYQLYVRKLEPRGVGALELAFRQLQEKLQREGLFDPRRKRPLPAYPSRIAIVTSPTGAAIADMLRTIQRRYPCVTVLVVPVRVQGPGAAEEIAGGVARVNARREALGGVDVMIVGRGGGSLEDLWAFNEEAVARAIYASRIPVVSAVGHEVDVTISDLVADVRAATPTAAAELVVPVLDEVLTDLTTRTLRLTRTARQQVKLSEAQLVGLLHRRTFTDPLAVVRHRMQATDELWGRLQRGMLTKAHALRALLERLHAIVQRIAPHAYLRQMYARLHAGSGRLERAVGRRMKVAEQRLGGTCARVARLSPQQAVPASKRQLEQAERALQIALRGRLDRVAGQVQAEARRLEALSYRSVLNRGFSITRRKKTRTVVRSKSELKDGERLLTELADGEIESEVHNQTQRELFE